MEPVRFSNLKHIGRSAQHYKCHLAKGDTTTAAAERSMRFGSAAHKLILEPERSDIVVFEGAQRRGKKWDAFKAEHSDKLILKQSEFGRAQELAHEVRSNELAKPWLDGVAEQELRAWDFAGRACGGRPDIAGYNFIADVKTTLDASPGFFIRNALRMAYHGQMAWYLRGASEQEQRTYARGALIAVESKPPYSVVVYPFSSRALERGAMLCHSWMEKLLSSERSGIWPGYSQSEVTIDVDEEVAFDFSDGDAEDEESDE